MRVEFNDRDRLILHEIVEGMHTGSCAAIVLAQVLLKAEKQKMQISSGFDGHSHFFNPNDLSVAVDILKNVDPANR